MGDRGTETWSHDEMKAPGDGGPGIWRPWGTEVLGDPGSGG